MSLLQELWCKWYFMTESGVVTDGHISHGQNTESTNHIHVWLRPIQFPCRSHLAEFNFVSGDITCLPHQNKIANFDQTCTIFFSYDQRRSQNRKKEQKYTILYAKINETLL